MNKKLPYGISDFKRIQEEDFYYIDKTKYIENLENMAPYLFFIRPRRFGKSLLLSMLAYYYDLKYKDRFQEVFKNTYISEHPTKEANSYHVLRFDFSAIDSENPRDSMNSYCNKELEEFIRNYDLNIDLKSSSFISNLHNIISTFSTDNKKIYLILDEYDNFINKILISNQDDYKTYITDKEAIFKTFFTILKVGAGAENAPLAKMFITGVSPMALFDVTSGYNIGSNISTNPIFNSMVGVTEEELRDMISFYKLEDKVDLDVIREWYNNYRFSEDAENSIYNTDMILYYINHFLTNGKAPKELIDINVRSDYSKLRFLVYTDKQLNGNFNTLQTLIYENKITTDKIIDNFSALTLTQSENFKSLLYYLGLVTVDKIDGFDTILKVPNETIKRIMADYIKESLKLEEVFTLNIDKFNLKLKEFARSGDLDVFYYLGEQLKENSSIRDYITGESFIKSFCITYLSLSNYYTAQSEKELNKGFADIYLNPLNPYVTYAGLLEFKYIKRSEFTQEILEEKITEAKEQLKQYEKDSIITDIKNKGKKVKSVVIVFSGWEIVAVEIL